MKGRISPKPIRTPFSPYKEHNRGDLVDLGKIFPLPTPYKFSRKIREIFKILAWIGHFGERNGIFLFVNLGTGDPYGFGKFFAHPISYKFSRKIREIFKILWWIEHFGGRNGI